MGAYGNLVTFPFHFRLLHLLVRRPYMEEAMRYAIASALFLYERVIDVVRRNPNTLVWEFKCIIHVFYSLPLV